MGALGLLLGDISGTMGVHIKPRGAVWHPPPPPGGAYWPQKRRFEPGSTAVGKAWLACSPPPVPFPFLFSV